MISYIPKFKGRRELPEFFREGSYDFKALCYLEDPSLFPIERKSLVSPAVVSAALKGVNYCVSLP